MTSTNVTVGFGDRSSSRILKPPGGQSVLAFGSGEEVRPNPPRPKYDQQNSSNLFGCMGAPDPTVRNDKPVEPSAQPEAPVEASQEAPERPPETAAMENTAARAAPAPAQAAQQSSRGRVPPGGYSAGFW
ncbi:translation initiation factor IF-2 [Phlebotomus papatasi]|uniref:Uncharacterized protein n=1 Tax=Phlebotomus papatasi TaxID=29031 RepID=A0A1B0DLN5_PHLPP|nr:translation initiation factor IF-2 [Phlebotomus papatasi]